MVEPPNYIIRRPEQIRAIASPVRQEILDTVQALGSATIADMARELGRPADALYYHVRVLEQVELLIPSPETAPGRRAAVVYRTPAGDGLLRLHYDPDDPENRDAVTNAISALLRIAERDFRSGFRSDLAACEGPERNLWAGRTKAWLSDEDVETARGLITRLVEVFSRPKRPGSERLHVMSFILAPVEPSRRAADPDDT